MRKEYYRYYTVFPLNNLDTFFIKKYNTIAEALNEKPISEDKINENDSFIERARALASNHDIALMIWRTDSYKEALRKEKLARIGFKEEVKKQVARLVDTVLYETMREMKFEDSPVQEGKTTEKNLDEAFEAMRQSMNKKGWGGDFKSTCDLVRRNGIEAFLAALNIKVEG